MPVSGKAEEGAAAVLLLGITPLLTGIVWLILYAGEVNHEQLRLQQAADSMAMTLAAAVRDQGLPLNGASLDSDFNTVATLYQTPLSGPADITNWGHYDSINRRVIAVQASRAHSLPGAAWLTNPQSSSVDAYAYINEKILNENLWKTVMLMVEVSVPTVQWKVSIDGKEVSVLDYIKAGLNTYLKKGYPARHGLVVYASNMFTTKFAVLPPPNYNRSQTEQRTRIMKRLNAYKSVPSGAMNNIAAGLAKTADFLSSYSVDAREQLAILLSPGFSKGNFQFGLKGFAKEVWQGPAMVVIEQAARLRKLGKRGTALAAIQTQYIENWESKASKIVPVLARNMGMKGSQLGDELMYNVAGGPNSKGEDIRFHLRTAPHTSVAEFVDQMRKVVCRFGPIQFERGRTPVTLHLRTGSASIALDEAAGDFVHVKGAGGKDDFVLLSDQRCLDVGSTQQTKLVVRYGKPTLISRPATFGT